MDLERTLPRPLALRDSGVCAHTNGGCTTVTLGSAGTRPIEIRARSDASGPRSCVRVQNAQFRRVYESTLAVASTLGKSRNVSSRASCDADSPTRKETNLDRPDAFLPRARHRRESVTLLLR